jgi:hypothetical protein
MWLQKNNKLYKEFFSNFETIIGHFEPLSASSRAFFCQYHEPLPYGKRCEKCFASKCSSPYDKTCASPTLSAVSRIKLLPQFAHHVYL